MACCSSTHTHIVWWEVKGDFLREGPVVEREGSLMHFQVGIGVTVAPTAPPSLEFYRASISAPRSSVA